MLFPVPEQPPICAINRSSMSIDAPDLSELLSVNRGFVLFVAVRTVGTLLDSAVLALALALRARHGGAR